MDHVCGPKWFPSQISIFSDCKPNSIVPEEYMGSEVAAIYGFCADISAVSTLTFSFQAAVSVSTHRSTTFASNFVPFFSTACEYR